MSPDAASIDDVVGVEVTIDGMLVIADRLGLMEFPTALGIRPNIPQPELRDVEVPEPPPQVKTAPA